MRVRPKRLHVLLLKSFAGPFALTFVIVLFIMVMQFLFKYINDLIGKGLELPVVSEFLVYTTASMIPMALPLAILMAALMTFGNLGEFYELTAMKSSGISLIRIMLPLIIVAVGLTISAFLFSNYVLPVANLKMSSLLYDIQRKRPAFHIAEGIFYNGIDGYSMRINRNDPNTNTLYGIRIYDHTAREGNTIVTVADSGYMKLTPDETHLIFTLFSGKTYAEIQPERKNKQDFTFPHRRDHFREQTILIEMTGFGLDRTDESLFRSNYRMMSLAMLEHYEDSFKTDIDLISEGLDEAVLNKTYYNFRRIAIPDETPPGDSLEPTFMPLNADSLYITLELLVKEEVLEQALSQARSTMNQITTAQTNTESKVTRLRKYQIEIHRKFTLSFACLIFFFIGAPLGAIIRKGGLGMPTVISVIFFIAWYVISMSGEQLARKSTSMPFFGMWLSSAILLPIGIWLTYISMTDSTLMNVDTYHIFFRKIFRRFRYMRLKRR